MNDENEDNHPALASQVLLEEAPEISRESSLEEIIDADVQTINNVLKVLHHAWGHVRTVSGVCKIAQVTASTLKSRRELLNKQYGHISDKGTGGTTFEVPD